MAIVDKCRSSVRNYIDSRWFVPSAFLIALTFMLLRQNLAGGIFFVFYISVLLIFSDDTYSALCPMMFTIMLLTSFYDNYFELLQYAWLLSIFGAALIFHLIRYRSGFVRGRFFLSLAAVSVSMFLGGIGTIPVKEYFSGVTLYYVIGLGVWLLLVYILMCKKLSIKRNYDIVGRLAGIVYGMALLAVVIIALFYVDNWSELAGDFKTPFISYRNFCTTVMLFGMPMVCYFVKYSHLHLLSMAVIYFIMLIGGSRSALLFGTIELALCFVYIYKKNVMYRKSYRIAAAVCALPLLVVCGYLVNLIFTGDSGRLSEHIVSPTEARLKLYPQGVLDFLEKPVLGWGLGNMKNSEIYQGVNGSIIFYHNSTLQVLASLGLVGCFAFSWQLADRLQLLWQKRHTDAAMLMIPFVGVLLMSQTNPGSFCPLPTATLLIIMFAALEFEDNGSRHSAGN